MKVIFSRKGFDSSAGGCPSPIVAGRPLSLPIPTSMPSLTTFRELPDPLPALVSDLTRGRVSLEKRCHLDPDLDASFGNRPADWRGSLGQVAAAQGHLAKQGVGPGDLFLFWGLFRPAQLTESWHFVETPEHRIFGWLQIDEILHLGGQPNSFLSTYPWLREHPHMQEGWPSTNVVYTATESLTLGSIAGTRPGWGLFESGHRLTAPARDKPSVWRVPDWMNPTKGGTGLTYHPLPRWSEDSLQSAARGQEFIADIDNRRDAVEWLMDLFGASS